MFKTILFFVCSFCFIFSSSLYSREGVSDLVIMQCGKVVESDKIPELTKKINKQDNSENFVACFIGGNALSSSSWYVTNLGEGLKIKSNGAHNCNIGEQVNGDFTYKFNLVDDYDDNSCFGKYELLAQSYQGSTPTITRKYCLEPLVVKKLHTTKNYSDASCIDFANQASESDRYLAWFVCLYNKNFGVQESVIKNNKELFDKSSFFIADKKCYLVSKKK